MGLVLLLAFTLYALHRTDGPQQLARPPAPPHPRLLPTPLEPPQIESARPEPERLELTLAGPTLAGPALAGPAPPAPPSRLAPTGERKTVSGAPPRTDERRQAPSGAPPRAAAVSPPDVSELPVSATHVVGRLSAKNPGAAQRDFISLLTNVGGTELGRSQRVTFTAIQVIVPQSRYEKFAEGLARIGSWRLEAARLPLPDAVHMTIRMSE